MSKKLIDIKRPHITMDENMRDYSKEPAFIKAAQRAEAFLKRHTLPKEFTQPKKKGK